MLTLKNFSVADGASGYASKTTPRATLCITNGGGEKIINEQDIQVDVFSMKRMGDNKDLMHLEFEYSLPSKSPKELPKMKKDRFFFLVDRVEKTAKEVSVKDIFALWTQSE